MSKAKILFFAADPLSAPPGGPARRLLLDVEVREIRHKVRTARYRDDLDLDTHWATRTDDLLLALNETSPQVVHFSGHGGSGGLVLVGSDASSGHSVDAEQLARLFEVFRGDIRLVVLNACFSTPQAEAISAVVGCAIGTRTEITDAAAITFSGSFYRAIAFGHSVQAAYDQARAALALEHFEDRECPQLVTRRGVDPAKIVLSRPARWTRRAVVGSAAVAAAVAGAVYLAPDPNPRSGVAAGPSTADPAAARASGPAAPAAAPVSGPVAPPAAPAAQVVDSVYRPPAVDDSGNTVRNGGFRDRFAEWNRTVDGASGKGTNEIVSFADARSGYALRLTYEGRGGLLFTQKIPVAGPDYVFRGTFRASSHEGPMIGFSGTGIATVMLQYLDADGRFLGMTSFYNYVKNPFADTPLVGVPRRGNGGNDVHYIDVERERLHKDVEIDIRREIEENLLGVVAEQVRTVAIVLYCGATDPGAGAELLVTDLSLRPRG